MRVRFQKYVEPLFALFFIMSVGAVVHEVDWLENTLGGLRLFWIAFTAGGLLGMAAATAFAYARHELLSGMSGPVLRSLIFIGGMTVATGLSSAAMASLLNRTYVGEAHTLTVKIKDKFYGRGQAQKPRLVIEIDTGVKEHIHVDRPFWDSVAAGEKVELTLCRGTLGYDVLRIGSIQRAAVPAISIS